MNGLPSRAAVARSLANEPPIILADEPTGSLDSKAGEQVLAALRGIQRERGVTLLLVSHEASIAAAADRVVHMLDGRIDGSGAGSAAVAR